MAAALLTSCGGSGGALPHGPSLYPNVPAGLTAGAAGIVPPHGTLAVRGKILTVATDLLTIETSKGKKLEIVSNALTITRGTPKAGQFAQVVGRGTTKITALYLAIWPTSPKSLSVTGTIGITAADGFLMVTTSGPVRVVLSSHTVFSGPLLAGEGIEATGIGTRTRGIVATRIAVIVSPSPSPTPTPTSPGTSPSPTPTSSPVPTPSPTPSSKSSPTPTPHATATPTPHATATPTPHATATPTPHATATPTPHATATPTPTPHPSPTPTPNPKPTPTPTPVPTPAPTPTPTPGPALPPVGVYNSCEIDSALTTLCEPEDAAMASDGYTWEINYIGLMATKATLKAWFTYDTKIGMGQIIAVKEALTDPSGNALTGNNLISFNGDTNLASSCGATNNEQIISCVDSVANSVPGFKFSWYIYDEPGCPNQSLGYCQGTLAGGNYNNVANVASYIASIDPSHPILGTQVGDNGGQTVTNNLYSWLVPAPKTAAGFDHYPIPSGGRFGSIDDIGTIASEVASTIATNNASENMFFVGQAFSWYQEDGAGCTSITICPYPTTAQLQDMRDQALYYANKSGHPLSMIIWYYWPDITCLTTYTGCNAAANRASLKAASFAPFPTTAPSLGRHHPAKHHP